MRDLLSHEPYIPSVTCDVTRSIDMTPSHVSALIHVYHDSFMHRMTHLSLFLQKKQHESTHQKIYYCSHAYICMLARILFFVCEFFSWHCAFFSWHCEFFFLIRYGCKWCGPPWFVTWLIHVDCGNSPPAEVVFVLGGSISRGYRNRFQWNAMYEFKLILVPGVSLNPFLPPLEIGSPQQNTPLGRGWGYDQSVT